MPNLLGDDRRLLSVKAVARLLLVEEVTVRRWLREGTLHGLKLASGKGASPWRVPASEVNRLLAEAYERGQHDPPEHAGGAHPAVAR